MKITTPNLIAVLTTIDEASKETYEKKHIKAKRIILDAIKDHVIQHIYGKDNSYQMCNDLTRIYQSSNENRKMILREKLKCIRMEKYENVSS